AVRLTDGLVAKAHTEDGEGTRVRLDEVEHDAGPVGRTRARGEQDPIRAQAADVLDRDLVVAPYLALDPELAKVLHQVVDERVVVVDHEYAHRVSSGVSADLHVIEG